MSSQEFSFRKYSASTIGLEKSLTMSGEKLGKLESLYGCSGLKIEVSNLVW